MDKSDEGREDEWHEFADWLVPLSKLVRDKEAFPLAPDSILAGDEHGMLEHVSVAAVVRSMLDSAVDDLAAAYSLVAEAGRLSPIGIPTLVRGAIELCGVGMWVMTGQERVGRQTRALNVAYDSDRNAKKFFMNLCQDDVAPSNIRREAVDAVSLHESACAQSVENADSLGIQETKVTTPLNRTDILKTVDRTRETNFLLYWQLCSGFAHGFSWAPQLFHAYAYTHSLEGGGNLVGRTLDLNSAYDMFSWGRRAIAELQESLAAGRVPFPGHDETATIIARPQGKPFRPEQR